MSSKIFLDEIFCRIFLAVIHKLGRYKFSANCAAILVEIVL